MPTHSLSDEQHSIAVVSNVEIQPTCAQFSARHALLAFTETFVNQPVFGQDGHPSKRFREMASKGLRASPVRSILWYLFMGMFPATSTPKTWADIISQHRRRYSERIIELVVDPTSGPGSEDPLVAVNQSSGNSPSNAASKDAQSDAPQGLWSQYFANNALCDTIKLDLVRTHPDSDYFSHPQIQAQMLNVLFMWCKTHPEFGYRQGMNELCALVLYVVAGCAYPSSFAPPVPEIKLASGASEEEVANETALWTLIDPRYVEHDTHFLFSRIMDVMAKYFVAKPVNAQPSQANFDNLDPNSASESPVVQRCERIFNHVLPIYDPVLYEHLVNEEILPTLFLLRWVRLIFAREFHIEDTAILWDAILSQDPYFELIDHISIAMILYVRPQLLESDNTYCLRRLMKFPPVEDVSVFVDRALFYKQNPGIIDFDAAIKGVNAISSNQTTSVEVPVSSSVSSTSSISTPHSYSGSIASSTLSLFGSIVTKINEAIAQPSSPSGLNSGSTSSRRAPQVSISDPILATSSNTAVSVKHPQSTTSKRTGLGKLDVSSGSGSFGTPLPTSISAGTSVAAATATKAALPTRTYSSEEYLRVTQFSSALYASVIKASTSLDALEGQMAKLVESAPASSATVSRAVQKIEKKKPAVETKKTSGNSSKKSKDKEKGIPATNSNSTIDDLFASVDHQVSELDSPTLTFDDVIGEQESSADDATNDVTVDDISSEKPEDQSSTTDLGDSQSTEIPSDSVVVSKAELEKLLSTLHAITTSLRSFNPNTGSALQSTTMIALHPTTSNGTSASTNTNTNTMTNTVPPAPTMAAESLKELDVVRLNSKDIQETLSAHTLSPNDPEAEAETARRRALINSHGRRQLEVEDALGFVDLDERAIADRNFAERLAQRKKKPTDSDSLTETMTHKTGSPQSSDSLFANALLPNTESYDDDIEDSSLFGLNVKPVASLRPKQKQNISALSTTSDTFARKNSSLFDDTLDDTVSESRVSTEVETTKSTDVKSKTKAKSKVDAQQSEKSKKAFKSLLDDEDEATDLFGAKKKTKAVVDKGLFDDFDI